MGRVLKTYLHSRRTPPSNIVLFVLACLVLLAYWKTVALLVVCVMLGLAIMLGVHGMMDWLNSRQK